MIADRRKHPRLPGPIPLKVRSGSRALAAVAQNVSAGGLAATAPEEFEVGEKLRFEIRFAAAGSNPVTAPEVSVQGIVLRSEKRPDGTFAFAAAFTNRRGIPG